MPDGQMPAPAGNPLLWVAMGRQRVGKTAVLNTAVQYFRAKGSRIEIWNADQQNRTHSLSTFFEDAKTPTEGGLLDGRVWLERRIFDQVAHGYHAVLDAGGGWTGFSSLVEDVPVVETLSEGGVTTIGLFVIGPEQADLDYLQRFSEEGIFLPKATVIVLNAGLVLTGRSPDGAFEKVMASKPIERAIIRGAKVVKFPALGCMAEVTDRGLTFEDAGENRVKPGQEPMGFFDPVRVREWWTKKVPLFFDKFPPEWLPLDRRPAGSKPPKVVAS